MYLIVILELRLKYVKRILENYLLLMRKNIMLNIGKLYYIIFKE